MSAPTLTIASVGSQTITVTWTNNPSLQCYRSTLLVTDTLQQQGVESSAIRKYDVSLNNINPSAPTAFAIPGLVNGRTYLITYIQSLTSTNSYQAQSNTVSAVPYTIPGTPVINIVDSSDGSGVLIPFIQYPNNGGDNVNFVEFIYSSTTTMFSQVFDVSNTTLPVGVDISFTLTGVINDVTYEVACYLWNDAGPSAISNTWVITPSDRPNVVRSVTAKVFGGSGQARVNWVAPTNFVESGVDYYNIDLSGNGRPFASSASGSFLTNVPSIDLSYTLSGLQNGSEYRFVVYAHNANGFSAVSNQSNQVKVYGPPAAVTSLSAVTGSGSVSQGMNISFNLPTGSNTGGYPLSQYFIDISGTSPGSSINTTYTRNYTTGDLSFNEQFTGFVNGQSYIVSVRITNTGTPTVYSPVASVSGIIPYTTPSAPADLSLNPFNLGMLVLWNAPASNGGNTITSYTLDISGVDPSGNNNYRQTITGITGLQYSVGPSTGYPLINGYSYSFSVRAVNLAGSGPAISGVDTPHADPGTPQNLAVTITSTTSARLNWLPPTSGSLAGFTLLGYHIWNYNPITATIPTPVAVTTDLSYSLSLLPLTPYKYGVSTIARDNSTLLVQESAIITVGPFTTAGVPQIVSIDISGTFAALNQEIILTINDRNSLILNWVIEVFRLGDTIADASSNILTGVVASGYYTVGNPCVITIPFNYYQLGSDSTQPIFAAAANAVGLGFQQFNWDYQLN